MIYVFETYKVGATIKSFGSHTEEYECDADAMMRARKILAKEKRDLHEDNLRISLYEYPQRYIVTYS